MASDVWPTVTGENWAQTSLEWRASFQFSRAALWFVKGLCSQAHHNIQTSERRKGRRRPVKHALKRNFFVANCGF